MSRPHLTPFFLILILISQLLLTLPLAIFLTHYETIIIIEWNLFSFSSCPVATTFLLDPPALIFSSAVNLISLAVIMFSLDYIYQDKFLPRFTILVALFVFSINLLVFIPNIITLLIGWDGLGLVSFLLVIYYQNPRSLAAGLLTALTNRLGDALIILSIALLLNTGTWRLLRPWFSFYLIVPLVLTLAATTKRAQIPFTSWLPAAIAAPTPVSALVHSSTLVTAGIYLLFRLYPLLITSPFTLNLLLIRATLTTTIAGLAALVENDIKKIIALSTLSQLGIIIMSLGLKAPLFTFFHLITHAIFKALLFICAGTIIHHHSNNQDLRLFRNLSLKLPFTTLALTTANIALTGTPFLAGFYSKDLIIELTSSSLFNLSVFSLIIFSTLLTVLYSVRFTIYTLFNHQLTHSFPHLNDNTAHNSTSAIILLITAAIMIGVLMNWLFIYPSLITPTHFHLKLVPLFILPAALLLITPLFISALIYFYRFIPFTNNFLGTIWFLTPTITYWPSYITAHIRTTTTHYWDHGWNEALSAQGATTLTSLFFKPLKSLQTTNLPQAIIWALLFMSSFTYFLIG